MKTALSAPLTGNLTLKDHSFWDLFPSLEGVNFQPITFSGKMTTNRLQVDLNIPSMEYGTVRMDSLDLNIQPENGQHNYQLTFRECTLGDLSTTNLFLKGASSREKISVLLETKDIEGSPIYHIPSSITKKKDRTTFSLEDKVILKGHSLEVKENGPIIIDEGKVKGKIALQKNQTYLAASSKEDRLKIESNNFPMTWLSSIAGMDKDILKGTLNGNFIADLGQSPAKIRSELVITDLILLENKIGTADLQINSLQDKGYDLKCSVEGYGNDIKLLGTYGVLTEQPLDFSVTINRFDPDNLKDVESLSNGQVSKLKGTITGELHLSGSPSDPEIRGDLNFPDLTIQPTALGTDLKASNQKVTFDGKQISFQELTLTDTTGQPMICNGKITWAKDDFKMNMTINMDGMLVMNRSPNPEYLYHGIMRMGGKVNIKGTASTPTIQADLHIQEGTNFTFIVPEEEKHITQRRELVRFVDRDTLKNKDTLSLQKERTTTTTKGMEGVKFNGKFRIDPKAKADLILDQSSGDHLAVQGGGNLGFSMDRSGKMNLTGTYHLNDGIYDMTFYNIVNKKFQIQQGSSITWKGDPLSAQLDIIAIKIVKTSPRPLMSPYLANTGETEKKKPLR